MTGISGLLSSMCAYPLKMSRADEDQQVAGDMDDEIEEQGEAGHADQNLRADRRIEDA